MKAISTVIASILMLMITIALGGTTYLYISGIFTGKTATAFEIIDAVNDTVIIRNSGTKPITSFSSAIVDGNPAVYRVSAQDSSLVGYWKMDETSWTNNCLTPTVIDLAGSNNGKSCPAGTGPVGGAVGKFGNAGNFDGADDYVDAGNDASLQLTSAGSIEVWYKPQGNAPDFNPNIAGRAYFRLYQNTNDPTSASAYLQTNTGPNWLSFNGVVIGNWYHLVFTFDSSGTNNAKVYKNGVLERQQNRDGILLGSTDTWYVGGGYSGEINGTIDEVKIYNRALSAQEVKASYNIGSQINPGEIATIKIYNTISKGTHTLRLCTSSMCNTAILSIL